MSTRTEIVIGFYDRADEDSRLKRSRHGQLEYAVTMNYIHRFTAPGANILEVGCEVVTSYEKDRVVESVP